MTQDIFHQFLISISGVLFALAGGGVYRALFGYDLPAEEVAIVTIGTISIGRAAGAVYQDVQARKYQGGPPPQ